MKDMPVLGIMSGTSIDSVDYALCVLRDGRVELRKHWQVKFPRLLQERLHGAARGLSSSHELCQLHHDLGRFYAIHARVGSPRQRPQLIGLHGQTVFHNPVKEKAATFQLGEPAYLVQVLGVPVVSNFRAADLAAGGQGAPLATLFHQTVFARRGQHVCVNNLGGISNVTSIDWRRQRAPRVTSFDTGPANVLLDLAMRHLTAGKKHLDENGHWANRGQVREDCLRGWLCHPYFARKPPKSTGRELFGEAFLERLWPRMRKGRLSRFDVLATLTEFTARSLLLNYQLHLRCPPQQVILTGGGAANAVLVRSIERNLRKLSAATEVVTSEALGWPLQSIEPAAFALLAWRRVQGKPGNLPQTTGASRACLLGQISEP